RRISHRLARDSGFPALPRQMDRLGGGSAGHPCRRSTPKGGAAPASTDLRRAVEGDRNARCRRADTAREIVEGAGRRSKERCCIEAIKTWSEAKNHRGATRTSLDGMG